MTELTIGAVAAMQATFVAATALTFVYVVPWLRRQSVANAVTALASVHLFRQVALSLLSAQRFGFVITDGGRDEIIYGDLVGLVLALVTLGAARVSSPFTRPLAWTLVAATVLDLSNAILVGLRENLFEQAHDLSWALLTLYVPVLWIATALMAWILWTRRGPITSEPPTADGLPSGR